MLGDYMRIQLLYVLLFILCFLCYYSHCVGSGSTVVAVVKIVDLADKNVSPCLFNGKSGCKGRGYN